MLVSASEAISVLDPLAALEAVERAAQTDDELAALLRAGRMFWTSSRDEFALAGIGAAATIAPTGPERFSSADRAWRALLDGALGDEARIDTPTVGPILMGGFSFEPDGPRSELWRGFSSTHLVVPGLHVTARGGRCWLTAATLVGVDGQLSIGLDLLARLRAIVLATPVRARMESSEPAFSPRLTFADVRPEAEWRAFVGDAVAAIHEGTLQKVVLARAVHTVAAQDVNVTALLDHLRSVHRDGYTFGYWRGEHAFVGASPERLVRLAGRDVEASSLAGSARRGASPREDAALAAELQSSAKDRVEHAMVRSALRGALAQLCDDVTSMNEPSLLTLPHVHHLHTAVRARLRPGHSMLDLVGALHPTPAVGGAPRASALRFIREREQLDRGWYAGPIGWIGRDGGELAVALRCALIAGREATLFAGCGIVAASDPALELAESEIKLRPMQSALAVTLGESAPGLIAMVGAPARQA